MADSKKYNGSTWEHSLRKLTTSTDTLTTLPVNIYADGNKATVGISGNTVQNGTPTPDNPIMPQCVGERTRNLINIYANDTSNGYFDNAMILSSGSIYTPSYGFVSEYQPIDEDATYTLNTGGPTGIGQSICFYTSNKQFISGATYENKSVITFTTPQGARYFRCTVMRTQNDTESYKHTMLNTGSTPLPYEPYGVKIPILSNSTTTPIYLGEVQTTRKIKKLVLTGNETTIGAYDSTYSRFPLIISDSLILGVRKSPVVSSHYIGISDGRTISEVPNNAIYSDNASSRWFIKTTDFNNATALKAYLTNQYAAGTPVCVWYVLAEPTTGIVNEPLMKIGDYADTVSGITIPTITSKDTFDVETTLKPSEVELTYTGWHDATVEEWDGSQWQ